MAISRATKTNKVKVLTKELATSTSAIIGTFSGLTASKDFELRKAVRAAGASYHVVKNKLAAKASQGSKIEAALQGLKGVSAVAYTSGDPVVLAKALSTWVKDNSEFTFKLAIVDGQILNVKEISDLATLPGKEELFSKLLFLIQSPAQRLATVINATGRDLAVVLGQGVEKEKFAAGPEPVAPTPAAPAETAAAAEPEVAAAHAEEALTPEEAIAANPASEADAAQPENGTASQAGAAANEDPAEGA
jgi:large subunit ribosomal protein L10